MKLKPLRYRDLIKKAKNAGFILKRSTGGSHEIWWHSQKKKTCVIPYHKEIKSGTLRSIIKQMGITTKQFEEL